jgi:hypothetical protein
MRVVQMHDQRAQRQLLLAAFGGMDLTDKQWAVLEPIFRSRRRPDGRGRPWTAPRAVLSTASSGSCARALRGTICRAAIRRIRPAIVGEEESGLEGEGWLGALGNIAGSLWGEGEEEFEDESSFESEDEGEQFFGT